MQNPDGVAVIIGNKSYTHPDVPEVSFAHNDADAIKRYVIETLGFRDGPPTITFEPATLAPPARSKHKNGIFPAPAVNPQSTA